MKVVKLLLTASILFFIAGFAYIAMIDVPIEQNQVTRTIPNERFFGG
jgi:hypothetical protein